MAATHYGVNAPFGIVDPLPLEGFPEGRARIKMRTEEFVKVYIKTPTEIREFFPIISDGKWIPFCEVGRNERTSNE